MMMSLLTGFDGRINRAKWWLGTLILIVVAIVLYLILGSIIGSPGLLQFILSLILAYPTTALMVKRLHDRDRPGFFTYIFWAPTVLSVLGGLLGLTMTTVDMGGVAMPQMTTLGTIIALAGLPIGIWALIELGILKGTEGPNQHGPDPLGGM
ncbi:MAG: DUF805 domain-containing protein [Pseudomonadota bacterium]